MLRDSESAKEGVDVIVYVIDASEVPNFELANKLAKQDIPVILCFNKVDLVNAEIGESRLARYLEILPDCKVIRMSAKEGFGIEELLKEIKSHFEEGDLIFPEDIVSDRPKEFIISEIIREKCMRLLSKEVPHSIYVDMKHVSEDEEGMEIFADIIVEKESEKAIVIGKGGKMISEICRYSEQSISSYFGMPVRCELLVKAIPDWRNQDKYLKKFGYEE